MIKRNRKTSMAATLAAAGLLLLAGCQQEPLTLVLSPEAADLQPLVHTSLTGTPWEGLKTSVEAPGTPVRNALRLTSTPGWNLPKGSDPGALLPSDAGLKAVPRALSALGAQPGNTWSAVPVLFDVTGATRFAARESDPRPDRVGWKELQAEPTVLSAAGGMPSFRQAAFYLLVGDRIPVPSGSSPWFLGPSGTWTAYFGEMSALVREKNWTPNAWRWTRNDQVLSYKPGNPAMFLESFRDYERTNPPGIRRFAPLTSTSATGPYSLAGTVLFLEFRGAQDRAAEAARCIQALGSSRFPVLAGTVEKWLAASMAAPELDADGAHVRQLAQGADRFYPTTDRLPKSLDFHNLVVDVQLTVDQTPQTPSVPAPSPNSKKK